MHFRGWLDLPITVVGKIQFLACKLLLKIAAYMKVNPGSCIVIDGKLGKRPESRVG